MTHEEQLKTLSNRNWIRARKALKCLKDGIEIFVDNCMKDVQNTFLQDIGHNLSHGVAFCGRCTTKNVIPCPTYGICNVTMRAGICYFHDKNDPPQRYRKCPNNVCDRLCEKIQDHHRYRKPSWKNTEASMWCKNHWEIAKCFLPYDNYGEMESASETDCSGLLHVIVNCLPIQNRLNVVINPPHDIVSKNIKAGITILHSRKLELTEQDLHEYIDGMITLLQDSKLLDKDPEAILTVEKLKQLKSDKLVISTDDSINIRKQVLSVIEGKKRAIEDKEAKNTELSGLQKGNASTQCTRVGRGASKYPSSPPKRTKDSVLSGIFQSVIESWRSSTETSATPDRTSFQTVESATRQSIRKRRGASTYQSSPPKHTKASIPSTSKLIGLADQGSPPKRVKDSWATCLKEHSEETAQQLLKSNKLPSEKELKQAWGLWGDSDPVLIENICKSISDKISKMSKSIVSVCPTYNANTRDNVVFVVVSSSHIDVKIKYRVMHRLSGEYNKEGKKVSAFVANSNSYSRLSAKDKHELHTCIENNSKRLLKNHSNITIITSCPVKSTNYLSDKKNAMKEDKCVVLYVPIKGQIPINEKPFDKDLDGIPIDVREGGFEFCSNDKHMLQMGCRIGVSDSFGTLGPFIDYKNHTCFLTSAHVVLNSPQLNYLRTEETIKWDHMEGPKVYLTGTNTEEKVYIGNVIRAEHRCGGESKAGVEVAVVAAYIRQPQSGNCNFPDEYNGIQKATYTSGQICFPSQFDNDTYVVMFGSSSKQSRGYFRSNDAVIREKVTFGENDWYFELHNQIVIDPVDTTNEFGQPGDSGSLVFVEFGGDRSDLRAFGIFEGRLRDGKYIVTPINDILEVLQHPKMKELSENVNEITELKKEMQLLKTQMASITML